MIDVEKLNDIYANYIDLEYDMRCLLKLLSLYEEYYGYNGNYELKDSIHIISGIVSVEQKKLLDGNENFDKFLLEI